MARPKTPIISRQLVIDAALRVVDNEGLAALTLRRLSDELGVKIGSLYYHYRYKDEILHDLMREVLAPVTPPDEAARDWKELILQRSMAYFRVLRAHPNLAALGFSVIPQTLGYKAETVGAEVMIEAGVPSKYVIVLREQIELAIRGILQFSFDRPMFGEVPEDHPLLRALVAESRTVPPEERLELALRVILDGIEQRLPEWRKQGETGSPARPPKRQAKARRT